MVRVLRYLADYGGSADSAEIRRGVPGYEGESGHRLWRRDLRELQSRGLVTSKSPGEGMKAEILLARLVKPQRLFLTLDEHEALAEIEDRLVRAEPRPSPLPEESWHGLHNLGRLARYLEERPGQKLTYAQVEQALGLQRERLTELLRQITVEDEYEEYVYGSAEHPALDWIDHMPPDEEDQDGWVRSEDVAAVLGVELEAVFDPHDRTGQLGLFAYSAAEADDRLDLIGRALTELDLSADQRRLLDSARGKLREWRALLPEA